MPRDVPQRFQAHALRHSALERVHKLIMIGILYAVRHGACNIQFQSNPARIKDGAKLA